MMYLQVTWPSHALVLGVACIRRVANVMIEDDEGSSAQHITPTERVSLSWLQSLHLHRSDE